nr:uncharacterized protein LOC117858296 isoform X2 [Setaria viridis]
MEWPQHRRVPAFGDWNYPRAGDGAGAGVDDWPLTPCFDAFIRIAAPPPAHKPNKWARPNARRKRIPAFGEWNHHGGGGGGGSWPAATVTPFFDLAAVHGTPNKTERWDGDSVTAAKLPTAEPRGRGRSKVADSGAYAARRSCFTVAKPVDDDLYGIPPDMVYKNASRAGGWLRILLMRYCCCLCPRGSC